MLVKNKTTCFYLNITGLLCKFMRNECLNHKYIYESAHPLNRLIFKVAESKTKNIQI